MPTTSSGCAPVALNVMSTELPIERPLPSASVFDTRTAPGCDRSARDPAVIVMSATCAKVAGSTAIGKVSDDDGPTWASVWRSSDTTEKLGSCRSWSARCVENGLNWLDERVRSAPRTSSSVLTAEALSDAANTETNATSPRPIISADAVDAVRRGLRLAFSSPSRPVAVRRNGRPMTAAKPRANNGDSVATPRNVSAAPSPTSTPGFDAPPNKADEIAAMPSASTTPPMMTRLRIDESGVELSRSASIGATRDARRDGTHAATTVTPIPTISDTTTVRVSIASAVGGSLRPSAPSSALSPNARTTPSPMPRTEPISPTANDSSSTEVRTWRRLAPSARKSASSRVRCDTTMLNMLKMMNAPTNSATNPKIRKNVRRNPRPWDTCACCWLAADAAVIDSYPFGSTDETRLASWFGSTPGSALTYIVSNAPWRSKSFCAVGRSNNASVAPRRLFEEPKRATPDTVNSPGPV